MQEHESRLISVIIPICNVEAFLDQCLNSIRNQTYSNLEIICLNDGSSDASLGIIRKHAAKDARIVVIDKENEGYGATCNRGLDIAKGEYVSIVEPDDFLVLSMFEDMMTFASSFDQPIDIVKTPWIDITCWNDPAKEKKEPSTLYRRISTSTKPFQLKDAPVLIEAHPSIWSALYRKTFLDEKGIRFIPYPGAGWADNPFLIETLCQARSIIYLDKPYYNYRNDLPGSTCNHKTSEAVARPFERWLKMLDILDRLNVSDRGIIEAHYLRGFNYIAGAIQDDGWDNELVREKTRELFASMDRSIVLEHPKLHPQKKRFYLEQTDQLGEHIPYLPYMGHLFKETLHTVKTKGLASAIARIVRHSPIERPRETRYDN